MADIAVLLNKRFTLGDLIDVCKPSESVLSQWKDLWRLKQTLCPRSFASGRANYIWIHEMLGDLSMGKWRYGGQGNANPDFFYNHLRSETKGFDPKDRYKQGSKKGQRKFVSVAASAFFAKNSGTKKYSDLKKIDPEKARKLLFQNSYDKNDTYLLTGSNGGLDGDMEDLELVWMETDWMVERLKPDDDRRLDLERVYREIDVYEQ